MSAQAIVANAKEVTIPFFRVGVPEHNLAETVKAVQAAVKAQKP
jgi:hypothetical protein